MREAPASLPLRPYVIRDVTDPWAMRGLEGVQVDAWGYPDREVLPSSMFRISSVCGGVVLGAYPADAPSEGSSAAPALPFGLAFGFPALRDGQLWHHSHLLAVHPDWRGSGLAVALKYAQRERVLAQGITRMTWTFDPLIARNARLNLGKLGARAISYHPDWYALGDDPATAFPADRLMIEWDLSQPRAAHPPPAPDGEVVLAALPEGEEPDAPRLGLDSPQVLAEVPRKAELMNEPLRLGWRLALREVLGEYLGRGYVVTDLAADGEQVYYVLTRE
ncbi:putative GNAT superfamily acetyltransferase [Deinococcus humi]|uniref:Putative GNAT superfamily acetyltransferase n=2 Tax=Deinococcus humi TaxID=662880 RepID=A0A7W8JU68_9DEIO|nr:putative GNAT superfamily acetyltransferase [Deinococcus humi]GGO27159.1 acyl-CoA N-acyltransferase [Deinococcus humi]